MTSSRLLVPLTGLNIALVLVNLTTHVPAAAADSAELPVLRGRGLEIVDQRGQVRASIEILPADSTIRMPDGSRGVPETVLLRLRSSAGHPNVKIATTEDGAGASFGGTAEDTYVQIRARGAQTTLKLSAASKPPRVIEP